ncbi:hypothetical protein VM1G_08057 [Cytospora mali]|uniref:GRF-like zinc ribbon domain-containing protein n=1 Tax=Cytospora mali TaxID=578113 RepID=A0A194W741_CYTMA|nr:hypothetical protein VM1G_08057 [Valsa mali]
MFTIIDPVRANQGTHPQQPRCKNCNQPAVLHVTSPCNPNGNAGRPYFVCPTCPGDKRWVSWADTRGIHFDNPMCNCGLPSRLGRIGWAKGVKSGRGFWSCGTGTCDYYSEDRNGEPGTSPEGFRPRICY